MAMNHKCGDPLGVNPCAMRHHVGSRLHLLFPHSEAAFSVFLATLFFSVLTQPLTWVLLLLAVSLLARKNPARSRRWVVAAVALLLLLGWQPLPDMLMRYLESQYAEIPPGADLRGYVGAVVLGGSTEASYIAHAHSQPLLTDAAERMTAPVAMLRSNPHLKLVYTGGGVMQGANALSEAQRAQVFFDGMGVTAPRIVYEGASRTTHENAVLSAQLPGVDPKQRWLLVTSAWHMPRSMATFAKTGWNVTAYPVDFRTGDTTPWTEYGLETGLRNWQLALHELLGWLAYKLTRQL